MNYFKVGTYVIPKWKDITKGDLDTKAKEYLKSRKNQAFEVIHLEEEDDRWLHRLASSDGTTCPTPLYIDEIMEFVKEWDT